MSYCNCASSNMGKISVTLREYPSACQCPPPHRPHPPSDSSFEAERLEEARMIALTGNASGYTYFDGSTNVEIPVTIPAITNLELEELLK